MADPKEKATALAPSEFNVNDHHLLQHGKMLITFGVMSILYVGADISGKTSGWIQSDAEPGVRKTSISGWKRLQGILDSEVYTAMVKTTADEIGFSLPGDPRDNNLKEALPHQVGRCQACHIEKKLGLWWVYRVLRSLLKTKDISRMGELRGIKLPPRMACATVFLNHKPCQPCLDFLDEINRITGIAITTREIPYIAVTDRPKVAAYPKGDDAEDKSYDQAEDENYDQDAEGELPETPRPVAPRKSSDPKVTKTLILSSPPKPVSLWRHLHF
ncbi:hypothetical protein QBC39DRAFT_171587 [Podospora conica]|nr:hypothetical protein QBC39DRAFT_171587 [Schizothecium conicum]